MGFFNLPAGVPGGALKPDGRRRPMDSKPGVLFFMTDFVTGGVERVLADVVNNLTENGCRAAIVFDGVCERNEIFKSINPAVKCYFTEEMVGIHTGMKPKRDSILKRKLWRWKRRISEWRRRNLRRYIPDFDSYDYLVDFKNGHSRPWRVKKNQGQKLVLWIHGSYASCWKPRLIRKFHYAAYGRLVCLTKRFEQGVFHDYPDFAETLVKHILAKEADLGILLCGTGIGISIAANRHKGIRAAILYDDFTAESAKAHNNANIVVFGGRTMTAEQAIKRLGIFLKTAYEGGRHEQRLCKMDK